LGNGRFTHAPVVTVRRILANQICCCAIATPKKI
jgi:hypothetical protein